MTNTQKMGLPDRPLAILLRARRRQEIHFEIRQLIQPEEYERPTRLPPAAAGPSGIFGLR